MDFMQHAHICIYYKIGKLEILPAAYIRVGGD